MVPKKPAAKKRAANKKGKSVVAKKNTTTHHHHHHHYCNENLLPGRPTTTIKMSELTPFTTHLSWEPPSMSRGDIIEYTVYLVVKRATTQSAGDAKTDSSSPDQVSNNQRFVSSTGNMEVFLSHTHSIVCALAYYNPK